MRFTAEAWKLTPWLGDCQTLATRFLRFLSAFLGAGIYTFFCILILLADIRLGLFVAFSHFTSDGGIPPGGIHQLLGLEFVVGPHCYVEIASNIRLLKSYANQSFHPLTTAGDPFSVGFGARTTIPSDTLHSAALDSA